MNAQRPIDDAVYPEDAATIARFKGWMEEGALTAPTTDVRRLIERLFCAREAELKS